MTLACFLELCLKKKQKAVSEFTPGTQRHGMQSISGGSCPKKNTQIINGTSAEGDDVVAEGAGSELAKRRQRLRAMLVILYRGTRSHAALQASSSRPSEFDHTYKTITAKRETRVEPVVEGKLNNIGFAENLECS